MFLQLQRQPEQKKDQAPTQRPIPLMSWIAIGAVAGFLLYSYLKKNRII